MPNNLQVCDSKYNEQSADETRSPKKNPRSQTTGITLGKSTQKTSQSLPHDTFVPCSELSQTKDEAIQPDHLPTELQRSDA
jgi:hypothetical protein